MLTPEEWEIIGKQASSIYQEFELEVIKEIAERIANVGYANTVALNDIEILQEMGFLYQDIINLVGKYNNISYEKVLKIFEDAGAKTLKFDDSIYKKNGLNPLPIQQSKSMLDFLEATAIKTNNNLNNLALTTANTSQKEFYNAMNKAYLEVSTGVKSYSEALRASVMEISKKGAYIEYPSGRKISIESASRMNILTSVNQTCGKLQLLRAQEMGCDLMEITAHSGARPEHAEWQGKIVSISGKNKKYLSLDDIGYGEPTGFKGVNCRHDWMPYYIGSVPTYTNKELKKLKNEKVTYNGKQITKYEANQLQKEMERQIKQDRKELAGLQGILTSNNNDDTILKQAKNELQIKKNKLNEHNSIFNDFIKQTGNTKSKVEKTLKNEPKSSKIVLSQWKDFTTIDEAKKYVYTNYINSDIDKMKNIDSINKTFKTLDDLQKQYPLNQEIFVRNKTMSGALANANYQGININTTQFNKANRKALSGSSWIKNLDEQIEDLKQYLGNMKYKQKSIENGIKKLEEQKKFKCFSISGSHSDLESIKATISHEYGHVLADQYFGQINKVKANKNFDYFDSNECWQKCMDVSKVYHEALQNNDIYNISYYASTDQYEFFAECFAKKQMGEKLPDYIDEMLERVLKNGK